MQVLTVGDGDLTFSVALQRCLGGEVQLTATTLLGSEEICRRYHHGEAALRELRRNSKEVWGGKKRSKLKPLNFKT
eukprot:6380858-Amphidinium_carterae.1